MLTRGEKCIMSVGFPASWFRHTVLDTATDGMEVSHTCTCSGVISITTVCVWTDIAITDKMFIFRFVKRCPLQRLRMKI